MTKINEEKVIWRFKRREALARDGKIDLLKQLNEVDFYIDPDYLVMEGLEISTAVPISVRLVLSRASGRLFLDIGDYQEADGTDIPIRANDHEWVRVEVVDT